MSKGFIHVKDWRWYPKSNTKMIYEDDAYGTDKKRFFLGPRLEVEIGSVIFAETSDSESKDGFYHIIKVIRIFSKKEWGKENKNDGSDIKN